MRWAIGFDCTAKICLEGLILCLLHGARQFSCMDVFGTATTASVAIGCRKAMRNTGKKRLLEIG